MHLPSSPSHPATSPDKERLLNIVRELARELRPSANDMERLTLDHALERDFGLDSLARVELLTRIEREMGIKLAEAAFAEAETPRDLLRKMASEAHAGVPTQAEAPAVAEVVVEHPPQTIATLIEMIDWHVEQHANRVHITLYIEEERTQDITYKMLQADAKTLAAGLLAQGLNAGDKVAIMLPTGREFFAAFYGALYAGCVPVPLYPPARPSQLEDHMRRIAGIVANAEATMLITDDRAKALGYLLRAQCEALRHVETVAELSRHSMPITLPRPNAHDIAFLQYTSGSTGNPKGVVLTHANLLANLRAMEQASGITSMDTFVSWLPLYHDMGLIGACMGSLCLGFRLVLMSPLAFLARPSRWLATIHRHRATVSAAPNFAYELCANKLDDRDLAGLDLSCWRIAYNGAEPVSPDTIAHFATRFARYGFNQAAITPVYGLAESSVGLAFPPLGRGPLIDRVERAALSDTGEARIAAESDTHARRIVSCGQALPDHAIRIVDVSGRELPERMQGRVQFRGPSATDGYFRNPEITSRLFDGDWLNTGDLGYLATGELYLTGREKDIIIRGGHNIHPQELEEAISQIRAIRKGGVAVFPATDARSGTERLVVLAETREKVATEERSRILAEINNLAVDLIGMPADDIVLAPPRTVLKTSSGKVRRAACREQYEHGELIAVQRAPWQQVLRLTSAGVVAQASRWPRIGAGWVWSVWAWVVFTTIVPVAWLLIVLAPRLSLRRRISRICARLALMLTGLTPKVEGLQHLADDTPYIIVANHASYLDALILTAVLPPRFAYVAKQELLAKPAAGIPLRCLNSAFVERFDSARGAEDTRGLEERACAGDSLVFFPEGTFQIQPGLLPFRMGAFMIAASAGKPVIPLAITGTRRLLRGEELRPRYTKLQILIGTPLTATEEGWQAALQLRDAARQQILARLSEPDATT
ncbi:MAG: AMP-binding protein [Methylotenera sp.]|nr:AMP-binding protein [Methylotenera sp.]MDP2403882.1 AMP-binding protein [Methylotenera sp.]MDP3094967.1 AMP-binding protein [Methylotenera sp.]MDZ4222035.1 AMP-binding protein [Methylotenera sp.]